jgi:hypothetical protein
LSQVLRTRRSTAFLAEASALRRQVRAPEKQRPAAFHQRFEDRALVYDCFWHADGARILMVGPPPMNLLPEFEQARFTALPAKTALAAKLHPSLSTMIIELSGAPAGTREIAMALGGESFVLAVQPNHAAEFAGRRVLFAMSKDNELGWIAEWARYHAALHGTDAVILFDNGSTRTAVGEIEASLQAVPGIKKVAVPSWPGAFGMTDEALAINPYWSHFLQISAMSVALRRFGAGAFGLLNCDIDELVATRSARPIYDFLGAARRGLVVFSGQWIEAMADEAEAPTHRSYLKRLRDPKAAQSRPGKWVLDPKRDWVQRLSVHPYWHWVAGRPWFGKTMPEDAFYWHFKGINTQWKESRALGVPEDELELDPLLAAAFARVAP